LRLFFKLFRINNLKIFGIDLPPLDRRRVLSSLKILRLRNIELNGCQYDQEKNLLHGYA
jgi:hypothetical protein